MRYVSLFSGAGGLDLGFEEAGWECIYASDIDPAAADTLARNQGKPLRNGGSALSRAVIEATDVHDLVGGTLLQKLGVGPGEIPLLIGGPPCQSWSSAGHQKGLKDPRGQLFEEFVQIARELGVRWIVFENVRGLLTARGPDGEPGSALEHIREQLLAAGFQTTVQLINAADHGVPQRRVRLFIIGFAGNEAPPWPVQTHTDHRKKDADLYHAPWVTLGEALANVEIDHASELIRPSSRLAEELQCLPDGSGLKSLGKKETTRPGGHWGYRQGTFIADKSRPARTVTASSQQDWIRDHKLGLRRLCPRECALLQSFPDYWEFSGQRATQYKLIGNAVPPLLGAALGETLLQHAVRTTASANEYTRDDHIQLLPLPPQLSGAIDYTKRDGARNGASRRAAPNRRRVRNA